MPETPPRLLALVHALGGGGGERQLVLLAGGLAARGWEVHVATLAAGGRWWDEMASIDGVRVHSLARRGRLDFSVIGRCAEYIAAQGIDVVQGWMQPCNTFAAIAGMRTRRPVALGVRTIGAAIGGIGGRLYARSEPLVARWSRATVVCNSRAAVREWRSHGWPEARLLHIGNGLAAPPQPLAPPLAKSRLRIGMLARLDAVKGHARVVEALACLVDAGIDASFVNWGADGGELARLQALARSRGVEGRVEFRAPCASPWEPLASIDVLVSASRAEGMSNSVMEAMAAGRVVVATDVGDTAAMLEDAQGPCGFTIEPDASGLFDALRYVAEHREEAQKRAAAAATKAASAFSVDRMIDGYERLYTAMLGRPRHSP